jgi:aminomethyltransferase
MNAELTAEAKRTPLYETHKKLGAKFTLFGGWEMPVQYSGLADEHNTVRSAAGLFDVSHMGEILLSGPAAFDYLQYLCSNDLARLQPGQAQYSLLLNPAGGVVDDIIVYMLAAEHYLLCVNAGNCDKDWAWIQQHNTFGATLKNASSEFGQIALQGPLSRKILGLFLKQPSDSLSPEKFPPFTFRTEESPGKHSVKLLLACTGYTGEDGFEIFCPSEHTSSIWDALMECGSPLGLKPAGLGARDTLRLEVCYPLHGHELRDDISALSSGLGWVVKFDKGDFIGRAALLEQKAGGIPLKIAGLEVCERGIVREGAKILTTSGEEAGWATSGTKPPTVDKAVAIALLKPEYATIGTTLTAEVRGKQLAVQVIKTPFYKRKQEI